jgi:hypothetical protein
VCIVSFAGYDCVPFELRCEQDRVAPRSIAAALRTRCLLA